MSYTHFIGIDVSKDTLDFAILQGRNVITQGKVENSPKGVQSLLKQVKQHTGKELHAALFCMEHTGIYNQFLLDLHSKVKINLALESSIQIKRSMGMVRGKSDSIDAVRIAEYAYRHNDDIKLWQPSRQELKDLKTLAATRSRLIGIKKQLSVPANESKAFDKQAAKLINRYSKNSMSGIEKDLERVDEGIKELIESDERLSELFGLIVSVDGVGKVTAVEMIITTNEFKSFDDPAKYACYSGVAPFEHSSGTSIRGRTRVSHNANKSVKKLLHMAALSAIAVNADMKIYYERKVAEGKNKMLVLNAVRRKLIDRIFACVRNNKKYQKNCSNSLA